MEHYHTLPIRPTHKPMIGGPFVYDNEHIGVRRGVAQRKYRARARDYPRGPSTPSESAKHADAAPDAPVVDQYAALSGRTEPASEHGGVAAALSLPVCALRDCPPISRCALVFSFHRVFFFLSFVARVLCARAVELVKQPESGDVMRETILLGHGVVLRKAPRRTIGPEE